jgi:hypothetical protein
MEYIPFHREQPLAFLLIDWFECLDMLKFTFYNTISTRKTDSVLIV